MPSQTSAGIQFVTGKGGVGKSTVAAAIASVRAAKGDRVLAVDTLGSGGLRAVFDQAQWQHGQQPVEILELTTVDSLTEYIKLTLRIPATLLRPLARLVDFVALAAPGVREILTIGKICHEARSGSWDHIVVDGPATGHIVELLNAPESIASIAPKGPLSSETAWMSDLLSQQTTSVVIVTLGEQLSSSETIALAERIPTETNIAIGGVLVNREAPLLPSVSVEHLDELPAGPLSSVAAMAFHRYQVGVEQRQELRPIGTPIAAIPDGIEPLTAAIDALAAVAWCTGDRE